MKTRIYILILITSVGFLACKKDDPPPIEEAEEEICQLDSIIISTYDTIHANPYLAAYPGSWWEYDTYNTTSTLDTFVYTTIIDSSNGCPFKYKNTIYLPKIGYAFYYQDYIVKNKLIGNTIKTKAELIIDTIPGNIITINFGNVSNMAGEWDYLTRTISVVSKDDTMTVNGNFFENVLHINVYDDHDSKIGPYWDENDYYYSREIGLIKSVNTGLNVGERNLVNYYIAPH